MTQRPSDKYIIVLSAVFSLSFAGFIGEGLSPSLLFLPGTQPGQVLPVDSVATCRQCHQTDPSPGNHITTISSDWYGSMMAHSTRDPLFFAALAVANKYDDTAGEWCIRCHSPSGWLAGHSKNPDGIDLVGSDWDGVQCDHCHRMANPLVPDTTVPIVGIVPGWGNGMFGVQHDATPKRGPYPDAMATHEFLYDPFQRTGEMCGVCHNVSNPFHITDRLTRSPHEYGTIERTYSEWVLSWYATQGEAGTCQACHMQRSPGYGCTLPIAPLRSDLARHDLTGGNTFVPDILSAFYEGLDTVALQQGKQRAINTLQRAAELAAIAGRVSDSVVARVRITNLTGHKLPTGYPEGRRMWITVIAVDSTNDTVFQSGRYDFDSGILYADNQIKVYEMKPGLTDTMAQRHNLPPGPSFHFILNDTVFFDNRIPPRGFSNVEFRSHLAHPVGYAYADGQYWDVTQYTLPAAAQRVTVKLYYQTASKEYIEFLRSENIGNAHDWNQWGQRLYDAWNVRGKSRPVVMNETTVTVQDSFPMLAPIEDRPLPLSFRLYENFPNPFNAMTNIRFEIAGSGSVMLKVYNVLGEEVATLVNERKSVGRYSVTWDARDAASGIYFARMTVGGKHQVRKLLLIK